jgi:two-component system chemotaxis response regulator CheY
MDIKRARVIVVEDEKIMSTFVLTSLRRIGILDLFAFDNGVAAFKELGKLKPDLIVTDIHMQPMGGVELVRAMRASPDAAISNIPVIFLSADSTSATIKEVLPLGVAGYLVKPPNLTTLAAKIEQALNKD